MALFISGLKILFITAAWADLLLVWGSLPGYVGVWPHWLLFPMFWYN